MATAPRKPQDRKPPARRAGAAFNLDGLTREGEVKKPFEFTHGGKKFILADPAEVDIVQILNLGNSPGGQVMMLPILMGDRYEDFAEAGPLPVWKVNPLLRGWYEHYGIDPANFLG